MREFKSFADKFSYVIYNQASCDIYRIFFSIIFFFLVWGLGEGAKKNKYMPKWLLSPIKKPKNKEKATIWGNILIDLHLMSL